MLFSDFVFSFLSFIFSIGIGILFKKVWIIEKEVCEHTKESKKNIASLKTELQEAFEEKLQRSKIHEINNSLYVLQSLNNLGASKETILKTFLEIKNQEKNG